MKAIDKAELPLLNQPMVATRATATETQHDTTPDLMWASPKIKASCQALPDCMAIHTDRFPIPLHTNNLPFLDRPSKRTVNMTKWGDFRARYIQTSGTFIEKIQQAKKSATQTDRIGPGNPVLDLHLFKAKAVRLREQCSHRRDKTSTRVRSEYHRAIARVRKYTKHMRREQWRELCATFSATIHSAKMWRVVNAMDGTRPARNTVPSLALKLSPESWRNFLAYSSSLYKHIQRAQRRNHPQPHPACT